MGGKSLSEFLVTSQWTGYRLRWKKVNFPSSWRLTFKNLASYI